MIRGFLEPQERLEPVEPAPMVWALVFLQKFRTRKIVKFLIDTGADRTCLHLQDSIGLVTDYSLLNTPKPSGGTGTGSADYASELAALLFIDTDNKDVLEVVPQLQIGVPGRSNHYAPALLGRDVLSRYQLIVDKKANLVLLR